VTASFLREGPNRLSANERRDACSILFGALFSAGRSADANKTAHNEAAYCCYIGVTMKYSLGELMRARARAIARRSIKSRETESPLESTPMD